MSLFSLSLSCSFTRLRLHWRLVIRLVTTDALELPDTESKLKTNRCTACLRERTGYSAEKKSLDMTERQKK
jgi:hypothetical protein